jgi:hypothetical protein
MMAEKKAVKEAQKAKLAETVAGAEQLARDAERKAKVKAAQKENKAFHQNPQVS